MIAARFKSARLAAGMSQADVADAAGLSQPFIAQIERGLKQPSVETAQTLARVLGIAPGFLFGQSQYDLTQDRRRTRQLVWSRSGARLVGVTSRR